MPYEEASAAAPPRPTAPAGGNPFATPGGGSRSAEWAVTPAQQAKYTNIFKTCNPVNGLVSGEAAKVRGCGVVVVVVVSIVVEVDAFCACMRERVTRRLMVYVHMHGWMCVCEL